MFWGTDLLEPMLGKGWHEPHLGEAKELVPTKLIIINTTDVRLDALP